MISLSIDCFILIPTRSAAHVFVTVLVPGRQKDLMWKTNLNTLKQDILSQTNILGVMFILKKKWLTLIGFVVTCACLLRIGRWKWQPPWDLWSQEDGPKAWLHKAYLGLDLAWDRSVGLFFFFYSPADRPFVSFGGLSIIICEAGKCVPFSFFLRPASPQLFPSIPHIPEPLLSTALWRCEDSDGEGYLKGQSLYSSETVLCCYIICRWLAMSLF